MKPRIPIPRTTVIQLIKTRGVLCQNCNKYDFEHIHHIDKDPSNNDFSNLILLCVTCHKERHSGIIDSRTIKVSNENHKELSKLGGWNETMDQIIGKCIDAYKKVNKL